MDVHKFEGPDGGACTAEVYRNQECGFPASNRRVHAPGAAKTPAPLRAVPTHVPTSLDHPATSWNAAEGARPVRGALGREILRSIATDGPATDDDIERRIDKAHTSVSSARNGLVRRGLLVAFKDEHGNVVTRPTRASGRAATVWTIAPDVPAAIYESQEATA